MSSDTTSTPASAPVASPSPDPAPADSTAPAFASVSAPIPTTTPATSTANQPTPLKTGPLNHDDGPCFSTASTYAEQVKARKAAKDVKITFCTAEQLEAYIWNPPTEDAPNGALAVPAVAYRGLPRQRALELRQGKVWRNGVGTVRSENRWVAPLLFLVGKEMEQFLDCDRCRRDSGPFPKCVKPKEKEVTTESPDGQTFVQRKVACANCLYDNKSPACT